MDGRNVIYPMSASDLVASAVVVCVEQRVEGDLADVEILLLEVLDRRDTIQSAQESARVDVTVRDRVTGERSELSFAPDTPVLVTGISRR